MNFRNGFIATLVLGGFLGIASAGSQRVEPEVLIKKDVLRQLESTSSIKGELFEDGKSFCSFDSARGHGMPEGPINRTPVVRRVITSNVPKLTIRLSPRDDPQRLLLVKAGSNSIAGKVQMALASNPGDASSYTLVFDKPLDSGNYEFGVIYGELPIFVRCGITVSAG